MDQNIVRGQATLALTGTAYAGNLSVADTVYVDGAKYIFTVTSNSVEGATLNFNAIGARNIVKQGNVRINKGDLIIGRKYEAIYNLSITSFEVIGLDRIITAEYDFSVAGGGIGTLVLTSSIPTGIVLKITEALVETATAPSSGGLSLIGWGMSNWIDLLDVPRPFNTRNYVFGTNVSFRCKHVPFGSFTIASGAGGTIDTVTVSGVNILNGTVAYSSSLTVTAATVAANINDNPFGDYRADSLGAVVYLYLKNLDKCNFGNKVVSATATTMTIGSINNIGVLNVGGTASNSVDGAYRLVGAATVVMTIAGADLLGGRLLIRIPYDVVQ